METKLKTFHFLSPYRNTEYMCEADGVLDLTDEFRGREKGDHRRQ